MAEDNVFLQVRNISKRFGMVEALKDGSFSISKGEIHVLLGENGAGKSTLIKILTGEVIPDSGNIIIDGAEIKEYHPAVSRKLGVSVVHQELAVFDNLPVYENIKPSIGEH